MQHVLWVIQGHVDQFGLFGDRAVGGMKVSHGMEVIVGIIWSGYEVN